MKIAISIWMFKPGTGGLQAHTHALAHHLQRRGHEVRVVTRAYSRVPYFMDYLYFNEGAAEAEVDGVRTLALQLSSRWRPLQWFVSKCVVRPRLHALGVRLYEFHARKSVAQMFAGADVIHHIGQSTALVGFAARTAALAQQRPFLVQPTCHPQQAGDGVLDHRLFRTADRFLVHTQLEASYFDSLNYGIPIHVVSAGIEDRIDGHGERFRKSLGIVGPYILYVGRKEPDKGYNLTIKAFQRLRRTRPTITLVCMGPPCGERIDAVEGVIELGFTSEQVKHDALAGCACLCVPSQGESFGLIHMEAARYAKPVVARRLLVLEELFEGGQGALLLGKQRSGPNDVVLEAEELAANLAQLLDSPGSCEALGRNGRRISEKYIWPNVVGRFEAAYEAGLRGDGIRRRVQSN